MVRDYKRLNANKRTRVYCLGGSSNEARMSVGDANETRATGNGIEKDGMSIAPSAFSSPVFPSAVAFDLGRRFKDFSFACYVGRVILFL